MTAWEPDPDGVLARNRFVRIEGGTQGVWSPSPASDLIAGTIVTDNGGRIPVPRGLEQHLIVLREVVDNRPTEPGDYNLTWESGTQSRYNPFTFKNGVWRDRDGDDSYAKGDLRRATYERLPDPEPECDHSWNRDGMGGYFCIQDDCKVTPTRLVPERPPVEVDVEALADVLAGFGIRVHYRNATRAVLAHLAALGVPVVVKDES